MERKSGQQRRHSRGQLGAHGLVRPSFVPPEPVRELRDLTRVRTTATRERSRVVQRLEELLEDTGIKLSAVTADIMGVSGRAMLEALIHGGTDPQAMLHEALARPPYDVPLPAPAFSSATLTREAAVSP